MKKIASVAFVGFLALVVSALSGGVSPFAGGTGSPVDPYQITNGYELQAMANDLGASYVLMNDIDASETKGWNAGAGFVPIGTSATPFMGAFNGQHYKIVGLAIARPGANDQGLFGYVGSGVEIKNVDLVDVNIAGYFQVGGLAGSNRGIITNTSATGRVSGRGHYVGGLVGWNTGSITFSSTSGIVSGHQIVGGLVGWNYHGGFVSSSYSVCDVSAGQATGGLVGRMDSATVSLSFASGTARGSAYIGGLIGENNNNGSISNSFATGRTTGTYGTGGLIGYNGGSAAVINCYSSGYIVGTNYFGGLIGINSAGTSLENSFWDIETSGQSTSWGGTGKTTAEMRQKATFTGWDFPNIWLIQEGNSYPYFLWFAPPPANEAPVAVGHDITKPAGAGCQADATAREFDNGSYDPDDEPLTYAVSPMGPYALGETIVTLTVSDPDGATASCTAKITVTDATPPQIKSLTASPDSLWPANHKMVSVSILVSASDGCSAPVTSRIVNVTSNEPVNGLGDGDAAPDWVVTDSLTLNLRAERSGTGTGRAYSITVECRDAAGNATTGIVTVNVPKSRGK